MSSVYRVNRKASDDDILKLNSVGLSLATIAKALECHPTTITQRLKSLKVPPADTRRSFMEDIFLSIPMDVQEWLAQQLSPEHSVKDFVRQTILDAHNRATFQKDHPDD